MSMFFLGYGIISMLPHVKDARGNENSPCGSGDFQFKKGAMLCPYRLGIFTA
jgi:hypothetical protein